MQIKDRKQKALRPTQLHATIKLKILILRCVQKILL